MDHAEIKIARSQFAEAKVVKLPTLAALWWFGGTTSRLVHYLTIYWFSRVRLRVSVMSGDDSGAWAGLDDTQGLNRKVVILILPHMIYHEATLFS